MQKARWQDESQNHQPSHSCLDQTSYVQRSTQASVWCQVERTYDPASQTIYHRHHLRSFYNQTSADSIQTVPANVKLPTAATPNHFIRIPKALSIVHRNSVWMRPTYLDLAAKSDAAQMAASSSTLSWESRLLMMLWWTFFRSAIMHTMLPSVLHKPHAHHLSRGIFSQYLPRQWLGRASPKWPILCRMGCKTLTQSINLMEYSWDEQHEATMTCCRQMTNVLSSLSQTDRKWPFTNCLVIFGCLLCLQSVVKNDVSSHIKQSHKAFWQYDAQWQCPFHMCYS